MPNPIMAGLTAIQDSAVYLDRATTSLSAFLDSDPGRPGAFFEGTKSVFRSACDTVKILAPSLFGTDPAPGIIATELDNLESGLNVPELPNTSQEPEHDPFDDAGGSEDAQQPAWGEQQGPMEAVFPHSYHALMEMAARFVGPLSLIVVPGLVLGVVTGQLPWGIALSGAIATVLSFCVGLKRKTERL